MSTKFRPNKKILLGTTVIMLLLLALLSTGAASGATPAPFTLITANTGSALPAESQSLQSNCTGTPVISSFIANPTVIQAGQSSTLSWGLVSNAQAVYLNAAGQSTGVATPGSMTVQPNQTTSYLLVAVCGSVTSQAIATVSVNVPACGSGSPTITSFSADPLTIQPGQTSTLSWGAVENAEAAILISPEGKEGVGTPGQKVVQPAQTTTYNLLGLCGEVVVGQSVTIAVQGTQSCSGVPSIPFFIANPQVIQQGQSGILQWGLVTNASGVYLLSPEGISGVGTPGQMSVQPNQTTTYSLYAQCGSTTTQANTTLWVQ